MKIICNNEKRLISDIYEIANRRGLINGMRVTWNASTQNLYIDIKNNDVNLKLIICIKLINSELEYELFTKINWYVNIETLDTINDFVHEIYDDITTAYYFEAN